MSATGSQTASSQRHWSSSDWHCSRAPRRSPWIQCELQMSHEAVIRVSDVAKEYRLGAINHGMLYRDLQSWWARVRGRPDPNRQIAEHPIDKEHAARMHGDRF